MVAITKTDERTRLIRLIHVGRRELGMDDDSYRAMLANTPTLEGATSSKDLTIPKLKVVLELLKKKGFKVVPKSPKSTWKPVRSTKNMADDAQSKLIRHLWLRLHEVGAVRDPSEAALGKFVCRMVKIEALQWLDNRQASRVIENLKKWLNRVEGEK